MNEWSSRAQRAAAPTLSSAAGHCSCGVTAQHSGGEVVPTAAPHAAPSFGGPHHDFSQTFQLK